MRTTYLTDAGSCIRSGKAYLTGLETEVASWQSR
jgi:hypothetical protein